ncbi:hypothetical protein GGI07_001176 [Coemansia sp. Benny D115]|nr:hypothetical protein GGI07_001176 [Coemansia sp. Benny D115]
MHLRHLGPARANLDNAVSTLLPLSGTTVPRNNPAKTSVDQKQSIVVCIGSGHNRAGFQLLIQDVDSLANGIACVSKNTCVKILLAQDIQKELKTVINSRLVNKLQALISDTENPGDAPLSIEVIDYSVPNNQHPTQEDVLAAASQVVVTADNIAAVSMAVSLHRPVYVAGEERTTHILRNYYHLLDTKNLVRRFYPEGSRYSYMLRSNISGEVDRFSATRDHEPWLAYNAEADLKTVVKFINQKLQDVYT